MRIRLEEGGQRRGADDLAVGELLGEAPALRTLSVEGFVPALAATDLFAVDGVEIDVSAVAAELQALPPASRVWLLAEISSDGRVRAGRATPRTGSLHRSPTPTRISAPSSVRSNVTATDAAPSAGAGALTTWWIPKVL